MQGPTEGRTEKEPTRTSSSSLRTTGEAFHFGDEYAPAERLGAGVAAEVVDDLLGLAGCSQVLGEAPGLTEAAVAAVRPFASAPCSTAMALARRATISGLRQPRPAGRRCSARAWRRLIWTLLSGTPRSEASGAVGSGPQRGDSREPADQQPVGPRLVASGMVFEGRGPAAARATGKWSTSCQRSAERGRPAQKTRLTIVSSSRARAAGTRAEPLSIRPALVGDRVDPSVEWMRRRDLNPHLPAH